MKSSFFKLAACVVATAIVGVPGAWASPVSVTQGRASQRAGTKLVDVYYNVSGGSGYYSVSLHGSSDGGEMWDLPVMSVTGNVGTWVAAGNNRVITWDAGVDLQNVYIESAAFRVTANSMAPPPIMVGISAGSFQMGDALGDTDWDEIPVHEVDVSAFAIQNTEATNDQMVEVLNWANDHGKLVVTVDSVKNAMGDQRELLDFGSFGSRISWNQARAKFELKQQWASGYPCLEVSWYGSAAWCNYRSEMEGLTPCFSFSDWSCNWNANGYRLPTEAEWEKAARGGLSGKRFPWGDTISHPQANYVSSDEHDYDVGSTRGSHPDYEDSWSAPVGSFPANAFGLYDMAGNVLEWCWDWYAPDYYSSSPTIDPRGPAIGSSRVIRGGNWGDGAEYARVSAREYYYSPDPAGSSILLGFRPARTLIP